MKTYTYKGTDRSAAGDVALIPGESYKLSGEDTHVQSLIAQGFLEPVAEVADVADVTTVAEVTTVPEDSNTNKKIKKR